MNWTIYRRALRLQRRPLIGWGIAIALIVLATIMTYPSIRDQAEELQQVLDRMPPAFEAFIGDISDATSGPGFVRGRLFALVLPLMLLIYAIGRSADAIAGDEERGALDLQLAHPNPRTALLLQRALAITTGTVILVTGASALTYAGDALMGLGLDPMRLALSAAMLVLHTLTLGAIALAVGAATGRRAWAVGTAIVVAATGYVLEGLGNLSHNLEPLQALSTFHHYGGGSTLTTGSGWPGALVLLLLMVGSLAIAIVTFNRRDIGTA